MSFQYGPVIKLPLEILPYMHDQPYGIEVVADWSNFAYKMVNLLLGHIGMLIV